MIVVYEKRFLKDLEKIKDKNILKRIRLKLEEVERIVQAHQDNGEPPAVPGLIKLQGFDYYFRIRVGDYRLGISIEITLDEIEDVFRFVRCLHRKDIYRYFP